jgi:hypothetical protein
MAQASPGGAIPPLQLGSSFRRPNGTPRAKTTLFAGRQTQPRR